MTCVWLPEKTELGQKAIENVLAPRPQKNPQEEEKLEPAAPKKTSEHEKGKILVVGVDSLLTQLARCCHPVPPDEIVGFVTRGRGVTVHRADCPNIRSLDEEGRDRLIEVSWTQDESSVFPVQILVIAADRMGLLKDISEILSRRKTEYFCDADGSRQGRRAYDIHDRNSRQGRFEPYFGRYSRS